MGKPKPTIKAVYGNVLVVKMWCEKCLGYAIVVDNHFNCCGRKAKLEEATKFTRKREAEADKKRRDISPKRRKSILEHQAYQCVYCGGSLAGKTPIEFDHFVCFAYSGDNGDKNFVASCRMCNRLKSSLMFNSVEEARAYICDKRTNRGLSVSEYYGGSYLVTKI